jgi:hypothetical protein
VDNHILARSVALEVLVAGAGHEGAHFGIPWKESVEEWGEEGLVVVCYEWSLIFPGSSHMVRHTNEELEVNPDRI